MGCFGLRTWTMGTRTGRRPFSFCFHPSHRKALHASINRSGRDSLSSHHLQRQRDLLRVDVRPRFVCPGIGRAEAGPCELPHRRLHHEDGASLAPGGLLGLQIHRNLCGAGSGAGSARPHRLRMPPAMGEKELARASVSQRAVPLTHAKQRSFALETISASQKTNDPAGRQGREVHGAGDGTRTREYKLGNHETRCFPAKDAKWAIRFMGFEQVICETRNFPCIRSVAVETRDFPVFVPRPSRLSDICETRVLS